MTKARGLVVALGALVLLGIGRSADAQSNLASLFSVSSPGARANAMGRAFVGVADDATAAITNPAGLVLLTRPQVYVEVKSSRTEDAQSPFSRNERISSPASASFLAFSAPLGNRAAVAVVRHQFLALKETVTSFGSDVTFEERGVTYGGSLAARVSSKLQVGATLAVHKCCGDSFFDETAFGVVLGGLIAVNNKVTVGLVGSRAGKTDFGKFMPSRVAVGVGVRPSARTLIAADVGRIGYRVVSIVNGIGLDTTEFNLGGEYQIKSGGARQVFGRAGVYTISEQRDGEGSQTVGTFGVGFVGGRRLQVDLAILTRKEAILSAAFRF